MREAGVNLVTLGVFAWARLEPEPKVFDLAWLDRVIDLLHAGGGAGDLATATPPPPPRLAHPHPQSLPLTVDGTPLLPGGPPHHFPSSAPHPSAAPRLVEVLADP